MNCPHKTPYAFTHRRQGLLALIIFSLYCTPLLHAASAFQTHTVTIDSIHARPDSRFDLTIKASDLTGAGVSSFDMVILYDASLLSAQSVTLDGTISEAMTLITRLDLPGQIHIAAAGAANLSGEGNLLKITFESQSEDGVAAVTFDRLVLNEGTPAVTGVDGSITVESLLIGDPSLNREISAYDAALVLQHAAGVATLSGEAQTGGDTSGNGSISAYDAALILKFALSMIDCFPAEAHCTTSKHAPSPSPYTVVRWGAPVTTGARFGIPLMIEAVETDIHAMTVDLTGRNPGIDGIESALPADWSIVHQSLEDGGYRIVMAGATPLQPDTLLYVQLTEEASTLEARYQLNETPPTLVEPDDASAAPETFALRQNYPNPFNPTTTIQYELPERSHVRLAIYDLLGREIDLLVSEVQHAGVHSVRFEAGGAASGTYVYRLEAGDHVETRTMLLVK